MFTRLILGLLGLMSTICARPSFAEEPKLIAKSENNVYVQGQFFLSETERNAWDAYAIALKQQSEKQALQKKALIDTSVSTPLKR